MIHSDTGWQSIFFSLSEPGRFVIVSADSLEDNNVILPRWYK